MHDVKVAKDFFYRYFSCIIQILFVPLQLKFFNLKRLANDTKQVCNPHVRQI